MACFGRAGKLRMTANFFLGIEEEEGERAAGGGGGGEGKEEEEREGN
jgi:hypothetical protein